MPIKNLLPVELPDIPDLSASPREVFERMVSAYEAVFQEETGNPVTLASGDPMRVYLQTNALIVYQLENLIKHLAAQNYLAYASGAYLDHISATRGGPPRTGATSAVVTMKFTFSAPIAEVLIIPAGTRVTPDGKLFFATAESHAITPGSTEWQGVFTCQTPGTAGNGFASGQITTLVDPLPYQQSVVNTDASQGGADAQDDANYAEVIYLSPEGFSVAGPELAYEYLAKKFNTAIKDVKVYTPVPGVVEIVPLLNGGEIPTPTFLAELLDYLSPDDKRPLSDNLQVVAPEVEAYTVEITYYIDSSQSAAQTKIQEAVASAIADYIDWQKSRMGRDINPQELIKRVLEAGAKRLEVISPAYTAIGPRVVALAETAAATYGGLESE
jgi:phage-related baseplate assembly protein